MAKSLTAVAVFREKVVLWNFIAKTLNLAAPYPEHLIVTLSLCTYLTDDVITPTLHAPLTRLQTLGAVIVAAAGNDATCRPAFPAAAAGVVGVGAIGRDTIAPFTKWGRWVRACAPGVNIVSRFFDKVLLMDTGLAEKHVRFTGWAKWSGTSFAAPHVAAALVNHMIFKQCSAQRAVCEIIDDRRLASIPGLGTIVNAC